MLGSRPRAPVVARRQAIVVLAASAVVVACAPTPPPTPTPAPPSPTPGAPAAANLQRLNGKVTGVVNGKVTLDDGKSFTLTAQTRVVRSTVAKLSDLQVGDYVAVTAQRQADNTLLASAVNVFPASLRGTAPGQRPMEGGNLMTNATIDKIDADGFSVKFPEGTALVKLAPNARLTKLVDATAADVAEGVTVSALVAGDVARSVTILPSGAA